MDNHKINLKFTWDELAILAIAGIFLAWAIRCVVFGLIP